jgi:hypothetical protein
LDIVAGKVHATVMPRRSGAINDTSNLYIRDIDHTQCLAACFGLQHDTITMAGLASSGKTCQWLDAFAVCAILHSVPTTS